MLPYQIKANEQFFTQVLFLLKENAVWVWPAESEMFTHIDGKLSGSKSAYNKVSKIVSKKFLENNFVISK